MEHLQLLQRAVRQDEIQAPQSEQRDTEAGQDLPDEGTDGGEFEKIKLYLQVVAANHLTRLVVVVCGENIDLPLLLNVVNRILLGLFHCNDLKEQEV